MTAMATMPVSHPLTLEDFEALRDAAESGHRYELVDGSLIVTPSPSWLHQVASSRLMAVLIRSNPDPDRLLVLHAPFDVLLGSDTAIQPDLMVFDARDDEPRLPLLTVEILSPSTRHLDIGLKWSRYASAGIPSYWVVDPDVPEVIAWQLENGAYNQVAHAATNQLVTLSTPWPASFTPQSLIVAGSTTRPPR